MRNKISSFMKRMNKPSYKTINFSHIPLNTQNKILEKNVTPKYYKFNINNQNLDEDDTKNNQNFKIFMSNLLKKEKEKKYILNIHSNKYFFRKKINLNSLRNNSKENSDSYLTSRNEKNKIVPIGLNKNNTTDNNTFNIDEQKNNEVERRSIGLECNIIDIFKNKKSRNIRNITYKRDNSILDINTTNNTQTFSLQEFNGKMLLKTKKKNYSQKLNKIQKNKNNINSFNCIRKIIPKNLIPKIMFYSNNITKKEKENRIRLLEMKEKAILFLKDKNNIINKNSELKNSVNSYYFTNEKTDFTLNKNSMSNINYFPLIKQKIFQEDKNLIKEKMKNRRKIIIVRNKNIKQANNKPNIFLI